MQPISIDVEKSTVLRAEDDFYVALGRLVAEFADAKGYARRFVRHIAVKHNADPNVRVTRVRWNEIETELGRIASAEQMEKPLDGIRRQLAVIGIRVDAVLNGTLHMTGRGYCVIAPKDPDKWFVLSVKDMEDMREDCSKMKELLELLWAGGASALGGESLTWSYIKDADMPPDLNCF